MTRTDLVAALPPSSTGQTKLVRYRHARLQTPRAQDFLGSINQYFSTIVRCRTVYYDDVMSHSLLIADEEATCKDF
jgi:hypothetical protein